MKNYYSEKLSAERLELCYKLAPPRVKRYLEAEIDFVLSRINSTDMVLELGCGYGRAMKKLFTKSENVYGIDTSFENLLFAQKLLPTKSWYHLFLMNAIELGFLNRQFDLVVCIQNGISAFKVDRLKLMKEAVRVTKRGGAVLFSSYSEKFWEDRLQWFRIQSDNKLIGELDNDNTKNGTIACKDGFVSTAITKDEFVSLSSKLGLTPFFTEVDGSSLFCELNFRNI